MHFVPHTTERTFPHPNNYQLKPEHVYHDPLTPINSSRNSVGEGLFFHPYDKDVYLDDFNDSSEAYHSLVPHVTERRSDSYSNSYTEDQLDHDCEREHCERIVINVSGLIFETQLRTLNRLPHTLLGDPLKRNRYWNEEKQEFFFDRHRPSFPAILYYYQSGGRLKRPLEVHMDIFLNELKFFEIGSSTIEALKLNEGILTEDEKETPPKNQLQRIIWQMMEYPESSFAAKILAIISIAFILVSVVIFCVETIPIFRDKECKNITVVRDNGTEIVRVPDYFEPLFILESCCICWFIIEMNMRFIVCPSKLVYFKSIMNWIDFTAIIPYFVFLFIALVSGSCNDNSKAGGLAVLRVLRVVRILKLSKHSSGLKILGKTLSTSIRELSMFLLFLGIATVIFSGGVYYAEMGQQTGEFSSIPDAFWWAIVSMTTVGYGDYVPRGEFGKCLGGLCVLSGVLAIALPVPVIVANFNNFYRQQTGRGYIE